MNNQTLTGKIVGGDSNLKTITIQCDGNISGVQIGSNATIIINPIYNNIPDDEYIPCPPPIRRRNPSEKEMIDTLKKATEDEDKYFPGVLGHV